MTANLAAKKGVVTLKLWTLPQNILFHRFSGVCHIFPSKNGWKRTNQPFTNQVYPANWIFCWIIPMITGTKLFTIAKHHLFSHQNGHEIWSNFNHLTVNPSALERELPQVYHLALKYGNGKCQFLMPNPHRTTNWYPPTPAWVRARRETRQGIIKSFGFP